MQDTFYYVPCAYTYVDQPFKKQKESYYEQLSSKLYEKNHEFTDKNFQKTRRVSNKDEILEAFSRIGRCLNHVSRVEIPKEGLHKVCLILMNTIQDQKYDRYNPQIGPMNDGYLTALIHHRLGFKIFYLYNCFRGNYPKWLQFFLLHTTTNLTVFYSGHNSDGIEFKDKDLTTEQIAYVISESSKSKCKTLFISDCPEGGSVFDISDATHNNNEESSGMISISIQKSPNQDTKECKGLHGIFTYYLCKYLYDQPNITPKRLSERMTPSFERFNATFICKTNNAELENQPIFK